MSEPPYWPFRCATCQRFVSHPRCTYNDERIISARGDCKRCGDGINLMPLAWEDWFGYNEPAAPTKTVASL